MSHDISALVSIVGEGGTELQLCAEGSAMCMNSLQPKAEHYWVWMRVECVGF